jgi:hypothetical protein
MLTRLFFLWDYLRFKTLSKSVGRMLPAGLRDLYPCLKDKTLTTGFDRHYIYHPAWAARVLSETKPIEHVDISSSLTFCTLVSAFVPISFFDYRPAELQLSCLSSKSADLLSLPFEDRSIFSLSCMHVVEHVGLGRYGDRLDPEGDLKAIEQLTRVLAIGGSLLFVVPIGKPKIQFNAHRIYSYEQILSYFSELDLVEFSLIPDSPKDGGLIRNAPVELTTLQSYACGCFWFIRREYA